MKISVNGSVTILAHDAVEPFVVKYFPPLPDWLGRLTGAAAQVIPLVAVDDAVSKNPSVPTASLATVSAADATIKSPFASTICAEIAEPINAALAAAEVADVAALLADVAAAVALLAELVALVAAAVWLVRAEAADVAAAVAEFCADADNVATLR